MCFPFLCLLADCTRDLLEFFHKDGREVLKGRLPIPLGVGSFGYVYLVEYHRRRCAYKELRDEYDFQREKDLMMDLSHPNIMPLRALVVNEDGSGQGIGYLMDLADDDLLSYLHRQVADGVADLPLVARLAKGIASGLAYLHSHHTLHRDLHIKNILMKKDNPLISDFNCGRKIGGTGSMMTDYPGMVVIVPPECRGSNVAKPDPSYDMYGYGLLVAQLVIAVHSTPDDESWQRLNDGYIADRAIAFCTSSSLSVAVELKWVIDGCVNGPASHRPTAQQVVDRL